MYKSYSRVFDKKPTSPRRIVGPLERGELYTPPRTPLNATTRTYATIRSPPLPWRVDQPHAVRLTWVEHSVW